MKVAELDIPKHLDYAATSDHTAILIVRKGGIILTAKRAVVGEEKFQRLLDALANQQSYESLELILA